MTTRGQIFACINLNFDAVTWIIHWILVTVDEFWLQKLARTTASQTRHTASTSMYLLTFRVRVTTPPVVWTKWNGVVADNVAHAAGACRFYRWGGESSPARVVRAVGLADYR